MEKNAEKSLLDALYCEEEETKWEDEEDDERESVIINSVSLSPLLLLEQDLFWDDQQLQSLFSKERETSSCAAAAVKPTPSLSLARKESVEWILRINAHYAFSPLTAILAVNYLDRFLCSLTVPKEKPWMVQLAAVTCLSLAAKVEETHVPLLLDLQVCIAMVEFSFRSILELRWLRFVDGNCRLRVPSMCSSRRRFKEWSFWCFLGFNGG